MRVENAVFPAMEQITSFFGGAENGPFVMLNLLKFKETPEYHVIEVHRKAGFAGQCNIRTSQIGR